MLKNSRVQNSPSIHQILGLSIDYLQKNKIIKKPNLIKIDVDGNEMEVLRGSKKNFEEQQKLNNFS